MGMGERENYLSTRVIDDKFIALDNKNHLTTWSTLSGKVRYEWDLSLNEGNNLDFSKFKIFQFDSKHQVFQREWFTKTLLISKDPIDKSKIDEKLFFHPDELKSNMMNQATFVKRRDKEYHEFKLIEIVSQDKVREVASFIYPYWKGQQQYLYFNDEGDMMFERLFFERQQIYQKIPDKVNPTKCTWKLIKRLTNLPTDFLDVQNTQYPFFMSPNFKYYLDID